MLGPGSFYTSVLAAAVVPGIQRAIAARRGRFVFVANLQADETGVKDVDLAGHLTVLGLHDLMPDVVVDPARCAARSATSTKRRPACRWSRPTSMRPHGLAHDSALLGEVLAQLT